MCSAEARSANGFDPEMILDWLSEEDPERLVFLWRMADRVRREQVGESVHLGTLDLRSKGLVEIGLAEQGLLVTLVLNLTKQKQRHEIAACPKRKGRLFDLYVGSTFTVHLPAAQVEK